MARRFFAGGIMPSPSLLGHFQKDLDLAESWLIDRTHYWLTSEAWLQNMDAHLHQIRALSRHVYGVEQTSRWVARWRIFFLACAEVFAYRGGQEWGVAH